MMSPTQFKIDAVLQGPYNRQLGGLAVEAREMKCHECQSPEELEALIQELKDLDNALSITVQKVFNRAGRTPTYRELSTHWRLSFQNEWTDFYKDGKRVQT